jgi:hypothetical protein
VKVARTRDSPPERRFVDLVYYPITDQDGRRTMGGDLHVRSQVGIGSVFTLELRSEQA